MTTPRQESDTQILGLVRDVLLCESEGLKLATERIDSNYARAVEVLLACTGKVITTGVGKSGLVARKSASTMTSTGTQAVFLHPLEAFHGDLGVVKKNDVILIFGKSGESEELNALLPVFKELGAKTIAIVGNGQSTLAQMADVALVTGTLKEACPFDLAPTTSTTVALAISDALSVTLMKLKNYTAADFARVHPGGTLGRRLLLKVKDILIPLSKCPVLNAEKASIQDVIGALGDYGIVLFSQDPTRLDGILTDGDVRRALEHYKSKIFETRVSEIMNKKPISIDQEISAAQALEFMERRERPLNVVPVMNKNVLVGLARLHELLKL